MADQQIYDLGNLMSGHTAKHLLAVAALLDIAHAWETRTAANYRNDRGGALHACRSYYGLNKIGE